MFNVQVEILIRGDRKTGIFQVYGYVLLLHAMKELELVFSIVEHTDKNDTYRHTL
jgi:hypothetical protein